LWFSYDVCVFGGLAGGAAIYSYEARKGDMFERMTAPLVGLIVGGAGGLVPPLGAYWLYCYADSYEASITWKSVKRKLWD